MSKAEKHGFIYLWYDTRQAVDFILALIGEQRMMDISVLLHGCETRIKEGGKTLNAAL